MRTVIWNTENNSEKYIIAPNGYSYDAMHCLVFLKCKTGEVGADITDCNITERGELTSFGVSNVGYWRLMPDDVRTELSKDSRMYVVINNTDPDGQYHIITGVIKMDLIQDAQAKYSVYLTLENRFMLIPVKDMTLLPSIRVCGIWTNVHIYVNSDGYNKINDSFK